MSEGSTSPAETPVVITAKHNGPFMVEGPIRLIDADGNEYPVEPGKRIHLCRCGASLKKPFCDGSHKAGFDAAERAARAIVEENG